MEKLGVEESDKLEKTGGEGTRKCPRCSAEMVQKGAGVWWCPNCGTKPMEHEDGEGK